MGVPVYVLLAVLAYPLYGVASVIERNATVTPPCTEQMKQAGVKCDPDGTDQENFTRLNFSSATYPLFSSMKDLFLDGHMGTIVYYDNLSQVLDYDSRQVKNCRRIDSSAECTRLKQTHLAFQVYPIQRMVRLELEVKIGVQMDVVLVSGSCRINCVGGTNDCDIHKSDTISWTNTNEALIVQNLHTSRFYCVRASIDGCCLICSETVELPEPAQEHSVEIKGIPRSVVYVCVSVLIVVFLVVVLVATKHAYDVFSEYRKRSPTDCTSMPFLKGVSEESPKATIPMDLVGFHKVLNPIDVLLLYSKESDQLGDIIVAFRILLSSYGIKVWDPLQPEDIEDVSADPPAWLANLIQQRQLRIILVETEQTIRLEQAWIKNLPITSINYHHLDSFFIYSLSRMHNPTFVHDYKRLFIARFGFEGAEMFVNFVPCARYQMPDHFDTLLRDIMGRDVNISLDEISRHQPALKRNLKILIEQLK